MQLGRVGLVLMYCWNCGVGVEVQVVSNVSWIDGLDLTAVVPNLVVAARLASLLLLTLSDASVRVKLAQTCPMAFLMTRTEKDRSEELGHTYWRSGLCLHASY